MKIGLFEATKNYEGTLNVWTKDNKLLVFDPQTEKQVNAKNPQVRKQDRYDLWLALLSQ